MKKILAMSAMIASLVALAGPKEDINKANDLFKKGKNEEAIKILKESKNAKGENVEYEYINYFLATSGSKSEEEAVMYLKKACEDKTSKSQYAINANILLADHAKTLKEKIEYLEMLDARVGDQIDVMVNLAFDYKSTNEIEKLATLNKRVEAKGEDFKNAFEITLGKLYLKKGNETEAMLHLNKTLNSKVPVIASETNLILAEYNLLEKKDAKKANSYFEKAIKINPKEDMLYARIGVIYTNVNELAKAKKYFLKAYELNKQIEPNVKNLFTLAILSKDAKDEAKYANIIKAKQGYYGVAQYLLTINDLNDAEKYAKMAIAGKEKGAELIMAITLGKMGKLDSALKVAKEASNKKIEGADKLVQEIEMLIKESAKTK